MNPGELDTPCRLDTATLNQAANGESVPGWVEGAMQWCKVEESIGGVRALGGEKTEQQVSNKVTIHWRPDLTPANVVKFRFVNLLTGQIFDMSNVIYKEGRNAYIGFDAVSRPEVARV